MNFDKCHGFSRGYLLIFIFLANCTRIDKASEHLGNAINWVNQASEIENQGKPKFFHELSKQEMQQILKCYRKALEVAKKVDVKSLNHLYPGLGDHFQQEFIKGVELYFESFQSCEVDSAKGLVGQALMGQWGEWYMINLNKIRKK